MEDEVRAGMFTTNLETKTGKRGRPAITYDDQLRNDTGLPTKELKNAMEDREIWKILVDDVRVCSK